MPPALFYHILAERGYEAFFGVPDASMKDFTAYVADHTPPDRHVICANEGNAVGMAMGYHLATGKVPVVYMQNAGLGNALDPVMSLAHSDVFRVPMLFVVGHCGDEKEKKQVIEPQHLVQGRVTSRTLNCMEVPNSPFHILTQDNEARLRQELDLADTHFKSAGMPYAFTIGQTYFEPYIKGRLSGFLTSGGQPIEKLLPQGADVPPLPGFEDLSQPRTEAHKAAEAENRREAAEAAARGEDPHGAHTAGEPAPEAGFTREEAIRLVLEGIGNDDIVVATTGMAGKEVYDLRARHKAGHFRDLRVVGGMGHASSVAAGIALAMPAAAKAAGRDVVALDGDGSFLMHMGAAAVTGWVGHRTSVDLATSPDGSSDEPSPTSSPQMGGLGNFKHIVLNNGAHDSEGGMPTAALFCNLTAIAAACGYKALEPVEAAKDLPAALACLRESPGPAFLEIRIRKGAASRSLPPQTPKENKEAFMDFVAKGVTPLLQAKNYISQRLPDSPIVVLEPERVGEPRRLGIAQRYKPKQYFHKWKYFYGE